MRNRYKLYRCRNGIYYTQCNHARKYYSLETRNATLARQLGIAQHTFKSTQSISAFMSDL